MDDAASLRRRFLFVRQNLSGSAVASETRTHASPSDRLALGYVRLYAEAMKGCVHGGIPHLNDKFYVFLSDHAYEAVVSIHPLPDTRSVAETVVDEPVVGPLLSSNTLHVHLRNDAQRALTCVDEGGWMCSGASFPDVRTHVVIFAAGPLRHARRILQMVRLSRKSVPDDTSHRRRLDRQAAHSLSFLQDAPTDDDIPLEKVPAMIKHKILSNRAVMRRTPCLDGPPDEKTVLCFTRGTVCLALVAPMVCANCARTKFTDPHLKLRRCSRCEAVWYCGTECQHADWRCHKPNCAVPTDTSVVVRSGNVLAGPLLCGPILSQ